MPKSIWRGLNPPDTWSSDTRTGSASHEEAGETHRSDKAAFLPVPAARAKVVHAGYIGRTEFISRSNILWKHVATCLTSEEPGCESRERVETAPIIPGR